MLCPDDGLHAETKYHSAPPLIVNAMVQRSNKGEYFLNHSSTRAVGSNLVLFNVIMSTVFCYDLCRQQS
jgi:hypothetical protein